MPQVKIKERDIANYVLPELKVLRALFESLHFEKSIKMMVFLEQIVQLDISEQVQIHAKHPKHK